VHRDACDDTADTERRWDLPQHEYLVNCRRPFTALTMTYPLGERWFPGDTTF
jgi:hypothetical protein